MWFTERLASRIASVGAGKGALVTASVIGRSSIGSTHTCAGVNRSGWTGESTVRSWLRNGRGIPGSTGRSYVVKGTDAGTGISCRVALTYRPALNLLAAQAMPRHIAATSPRGRRESSSPDDASRLGIDDVGPCGTSGGTVVCAVNSTIDRLVLSGWSRAHWALVPPIVERRSWDVDASPLRRALCH